MIHLFKAKNFYSYNDEVEVDFRVNENAPNSHSYFRADSGVRLSSIEAVVGPNAAGKSNLLKTLPFLRYLIAYSYNAAPEKKIPFRTAEHDNSDISASELEVVFETNGKIYTYTFHLTRQRIIFEELKASSMANQQKSTKTLFTRKWDDDKEEYIFKATNFDLPKGTDETALVRANASIVSAGVRFSHKESKAVYDYWKGLKSNLSSSSGGQFDMRLYFMHEATVFYKDHPDMTQQASNFLAKFDLGLDKFNIEKTSSLDEDDYEASFQHKFGNHKTMLPIEHESSGTQQLFILLTNILSALKSGSMLVIDEFDLHLHPEIQLELLNLFLDPAYNPNHSQIIFSTQSPLILNKLDKYQIILCEKNTHGYSEAWRLDDMSGVRADDSYGSKYLAGAYGALPRL